MSVMDFADGPGAAALAVDGQGRPILIGSLCQSCAKEMIPPSLVCPVCGGEDLEEREQPRVGTLYTYTRVHVGAPKWRRPLAIGYVDLSNGVRVFTHIEGDDFAIGDSMVLDIATVGSAEGKPITTYAFRKETV